MAMSRELCQRATTKISFIDSSNTFFFLEKGIPKIILNIYPIFIHKNSTTFLHLKKILKKKSVGTYHTDIDIKINTTDTSCS